MELKTERLCLKPLGTQYLESVHEYASDIENTKYMMHLPNAAIQETENFLQNTENEWKKHKPDFYEFAILYEEKQVGAVSIYIENDCKLGELGWILNKKYWGLGIASEAAERLIEFAKNERNLTHFIAHCDAENTASYHVMEKLGMVRTAEYRGRKNKASDEERTEYQYELFTSLLKTTQNTRDLGGYRNFSGKITKFNSLIRSDRQGWPCEQDIEFLKSHDITTVIDMRGAEEALKKPCGLAKVEGFEYYNYPVNEGSKMPESKAGVALGYIKISCAEEMANIFRCIANAATGVLYSCAAGKDRTGVVSAILLMHAGVSDEDIIQNYVITKEHIRERLNYIRENAPEIDINIATPCEEYMAEFLRLFRERFGDTVRYFEYLGLTWEEIDRVGEKLFD